MAEGARLESVFTRKGNVGSNPTLSAILQNHSQTCGFRDPVTIFSGLRLLTPEFPFRRGIKGYGRFMANLTVTLYIRIKTEDGKKPFCKPVYLAKGRLKRLLCCDTWIGPLLF